MVGRHAPELYVTLSRTATTVAQSQSHTSATVLQLLQTMALLLPVLAGLVQVILRTQSEREGYVSHAGLMGLIAASGGIVALLAATWRLTGYFGRTRSASIVIEAVVLTKLALFAIGLSVLFVGLSKPAKSLLEAAFQAPRDILPTVMKFGTENETSEEPKSRDEDTPPNRVPIDEPVPLPTETIENPAVEGRTRNRTGKEVTTDEKR